MKKEFVLLLLLSALVVTVYPKPLVCTNPQVEAGEDEPDAIGREWLTDNVVRGICVLFALKDFLSEMLLAFLPTMSTHNITYDVLKEYQIVPLQSGSIQQNRICLAQFANARSRFLAVNRARIQRVFIPLESFPVPQRWVFIEMINFSTPFKQLIAERSLQRHRKSSSMLTLRTCSQQCETSHLKHPEKLASSGFVLLHLMHMLTCYSCPLPTTMGMRTPLMFALNLISRRQLVTAFAEELQQCFSLPRLTMQACVWNGSGYTKSAHNGFSNFHCKAQKVNVHNCWQLSKSISHS